MVASSPLREEVEGLSFRRLLLSSLQLATRHCHCPEKIDQGWAVICHACNCCQNQRSHHPRNHRQTRSADEQDASCSGWRSPRSRLGRDSIVGRVSRHGHSHNCRVWKYG